MLLRRKYEKTNAHAKTIHCLTKTVIFFVTKWHAMEVDRFLTRPILMVVCRTSFVFSQFGGDSGVSSGKKELKTGQNV